MHFSLELRKGAKTMVAYKDGRLVEAEKAGGCDDDGTADQADQSGDEESGSDSRSILHIGSFCS